MDTHASAALEVDRTRHLYSGNALKLGIFGLNCSNGLSLTMAPTGYELSWPHTLAIAQRADAMGLEFLIPIARWRGFAGASNPFGESFETMMWAAGIAANTRQIRPVGTLHLPLWHPVGAAKQVATIDHLSLGRFAFNAVMGWYSKDMAMFGMEMRPHDERYRYGTEWMGIAKRIWTDPEPFDHDGEFFHLTEVQGLPKPLQKPYPLILNAGNSPAGMDFAAREADVNFAVVEDLDVCESYLRRARAHAHDRYQRPLSLFGTGFIVCRDTEEEARKVIETMIEFGDREAVRNSLREFGINSDSFSPAYFELENRWMTSMGGRPLVGTPRQVAEGLREMSEIGLEGVIFGALDYYEELGIFEKKVMPLLVEMGLRQQFSA